MADFCWEMPLTYLSLSVKNVASFPFLLCPVLAELSNRHTPYVLQRKRRECVRTAGLLKIQPLALLYSALYWQS